jgi:cytoskeletal protein CcmA (bactofilin family)
MFSKSKPQPETPQSTPSPRRSEPVRGGHTFSMIASDVEIVGNLTARVDLHIDGKVQGDVTCGSLVQGESSVITGKVTADSAKLSGRIDGSIQVTDLIIDASARISGDVVYENLTIAPGGQVEGKFKHKAAGTGPNIGRTTVDIGKVDTLILGDEAKVA